MGRSMCYYTLASNGHENPYSLGDPLSLQIRKNFGCESPHNRFFLAYPMCRLFLFGRNIISKDNKIAPS